MGQVQVKTAKFYLSTQASPEGQVKKYVGYGARGAVVAEGFYKPRTLADGKKVWGELVVDMKARVNDLPKMLYQQFRLRNFDPAAPVKLIYLIDEEGVMVPRYFRLLCFIVDTG